MKDYKDIDFVGYHVSVLNGTVKLSEYAHYFSKPFSDLLSYTDDDLVLAVELFGPYFVNGGHQYISQLIKVTISDVLFRQLCSLGCIASDNELDSFFTKNKDVPCIEYDVTGVDGFIVFGKHDDNQVHNVFTYNLKCYVHGHSDRSFVYLLKEYIFDVIAGRIDDEDVVNGILTDLGDILNKDSFYNLLDYKLKDATLSFTNSLFYNKMRCNAVGIFCRVMGSSRINELELLLCSFCDLDDLHLILSNTKDITYGQLFDRLRPGLNY